MYIFYACMCVCVFVFPTVGWSFNSKFGLLVYELNLFCWILFSIPLESMNIFYFCLRFLHTKVTIDYSKKHVFAVLSPSPPCNSELCVASLIIQKRTKFVCQKKKTQFVLNWTTRAKHFYALRIKPLVSTFISHLRFILLY